MANFQSEAGNPWLHHARPMPQAISSVREFNGKGDAYAWLSCFDRLADLYDWTEDDCLRVAQSRMTDAAQQWLQNKQFTEWEEFRDKFKKRFGESPQTAIARFENCYQESGESPQQFLDRYLYAASRAGYDENSQVMLHEFIQRLNPDLFTEVVRKQLGSMEEVVSFCNFWLGITGANDCSNRSSRVRFAEEYYPMGETDYQPSRPRTPDIMPRSSNRGPWLGSRPGPKLEDRRDPQPGNRSWQDRPERRFSNRPRPAPHSPPPARESISWAPQSGNNGSFGRPATSDDSVEELRKQFEKMEINFTRTLQELGAEKRENMFLKRALQQQAPLDGFQPQLNHMMSYHSDLGIEETDGASEDEWMASLFAKHARDDADDNYQRTPHKRVAVDPPNSSWAPQPPQPSRPSPTHICPKPSKAQALAFKAIPQVPPEPSTTPNWNWSPKTQTKATTSSTTDNGEVYQEWDAHQLHEMNRLMSEKVKPYYSEINALVDKGEKLDYNQLAANGVLFAEAVRTASEDGCGQGDLPDDIHEAWGNDAIDEAPEMEGDAPEESVGDDTVMEPLECINSVGHDISSSANLETSEGQWSASWQEKYSKDPRPAAELWTKLGCAMDKLSCRSAKRQVPPQSPPVSKRSAVQVLTVECSQPEMMADDPDETEASIALLRLASSLPHTDTGQEETDLEPSAVDDTTGVDHKAEFGNMYQGAGGMASKTQIGKRKASKQPKYIPPVSNTDEEDSRTSTDPDAYCGLDTELELIAPCDKCSNGVRTYCAGLPGIPAGPCHCCLRSKEAGAKPYTDGSDYQPDTDEEAEEKPPDVKQTAAAKHHSMKPRITSSRALPPAQQAKHQEQVNCSDGECEPAGSGDGEDATAAAGKDIYGDQPVMQWLESGEHDAEDMPHTPREALKKELKRGVHNCLPVERSHLAATKAITERKIISASTATPVGPWATALVTEGNTQAGEGHGETSVKIKQEAGVKKGSEVTRAFNRPLAMENETEQEDIHAKPKPINLVSSEYNGLDSGTRHLLKRKAVEPKRHNKAEKNTLRSQENEGRDFKRRHHTSTTRDAVRPGSCVLMRSSATTKIHRYKGRRRNVQAGAWCHRQYVGSPALGGHRQEVALSRITSNSLVSRITQRKARKLWRWLEAKRQFCDKRNWELRGRRMPRKVI